MTYTVADEEINQDETSPGVVQSSETLIRWFIKGRENQIDVITNKVVPGAISITDLKTNGFSVDRLKYATPESVKKRIGQQIDNAKRKAPDEQYFPQIAKFACLAVREIMDLRGERAFIVLDKLDPSNMENVAHASIYSALERPPSELKGIRLKLLDFFNERFTLEEIMPNENGEETEEQPAVTVTVE